MNPDPETPHSQILIVEDNDDDSQLLLRQLRKAQLDDHVRIFTDGQVALDFLQEHEDGRLPGQILAIFLDLTLPGLPGISLLRKLRAMPRLSETPVMIMTSSNRPEDMQAAQELNVKAYVSKPVQLSSFIKAVAHVFPPKEASAASA
jgi:CheY-like chemotaxis protein